VFHHSSNPPAVATPPHPEPTIANDAVKLRGCWTEQIDPNEMTAKLDYNLEKEDKQEYDDADADTSDAPATSALIHYYIIMMYKIQAF
jgi:hypothetical protein